ncbi:MAG: FtsX-like permease family protein [Chryseolinea sp.]
MLPQALLSILRNFARNAFYTLINLSVLVTGIASCILIILYVSYQSEYDAFHNNAARIFRIATEIKMGRSAGEMPLTSAALGPHLKQDNDFVEGFVRVHPFNLESCRVETPKYIGSESGIYGTEPSIFNLFSYSMLIGDPTTALKAPHSVVLTRDFALQFFDTVDCIGKELIIDYQKYNVTGVLANLPGNTDLKFKALLSHDFGDEKDWDYAVYHTYVMLKEKSIQSQLEDALRKIEVSYLKPFYKEMGMPITMNLSSTPLQKVHFQQGLVMDSPKSNYNYVYFFLVFGFFILCIASFNYINLSAVQAFKRTKEVGIKIVQGAKRFQLIVQFVNESLVMTLISLFISLSIITIVLPHFNNLAQVNISLATLFSWKVMLMVFVVVIVIGLVSALIPALYLTSFTVTKILNGRLPGFNKGMLFKSLLITQFAMSVIMIICALAVYRQVQFMKNQNLGLAMDKAVVIHLPDDMDYKQNVQLKNKLLDYSSLNNVSLVGEGSVPGSQLVNKEQVSWQRNGQRDSEFTNIIAIDENYFDLLKIKVLEGRNFDPGRVGDAKSSYIVNESFVKYMGWENAVGRKIDMHGEGSIIGIVRDYHYRSLHNPIEPLMFEFNIGGPNNDLLLSISDIDDLEVIKEVWKRHADKRPISFSFLDTTFNRQYQQEEATMTLFFLFSILVVLLTCIGLFGLSSLITKQRIREIGIRKILGGKPIQIIYILLKDIVILLFLGLIVATPLASWGLSIWLRSFTQKMPADISTYIIAWVVALLTTVVTAFYHTYKAVNTNPAISLKYK